MVKWPPADAAVAHAGRGGGDVAVAAFSVPYVPKRKLQYSMKLLISLLTIVGGSARKYNLPAKT